jgi:hypothetical protein
MNDKKSRRDFLKQGVTVGTSLAIGGMSLAGCCKHLCSKNKTAAESDIDFSRIAYCCIDCDTCSLYKATLNNDLEAKKKIAEEWGDAKKQEFKIEDFYCYGCKDKRSHGIPGEDCTVRDCAVRKGFATCAQCSLFEDCEEKLWRNFPGLRDGVRTMKTRLGIS